MEACIYMLVDDVVIIVKQRSHTWKRSLGFFGRRLFCWVFFVGRKNELIVVVVVVVLTWFTSQVGVLDGIKIARRTVRSTYRMRRRDFSMDGRTYENLREDPLREISEFGSLLLGMETIVFYCFSNETPGETMCYMCEASGEPNYTYGVPAGETGCEMALFFF